MLSGFLTRTVHEIERIGRYLNLRRTDLTFLLVSTQCICKTVAGSGFKKAEVKLHTSCHGCMAVQYKRVFTMVVPWEIGKPCACAMS